MSQCHCYKSLKETAIRCPKRATAPDHIFCGKHKKCEDKIRWASGPSGKKAQRQTAKKAQRQAAEKARQLTTLSGPVSFYFYPDVGGKRVLLLGDHHVIESLCSESDDDAQEVDEWLYQLASTAPECLDIFGEEYFFHYPAQKGGAIRIQESPVNAVRAKFMKCIGNYSACPGNLRYHYVDLRQFYDRKRGADDTPHGF